MKTFTFFLLFLFFIARLSAQCAQGNVQLTSQAEIDDFGLAWPQCDTIHGDLSIRHDNFGNDIDNLLALSNIRYIEGSLSIQTSGLLENLNGLGNLQMVHQDVFISKNEALVNLQGLEQLTHIGGSLEVLGNDALVSLSGLDQLDSVGGSVTITANAILPELGGLNNLTHIGENLQIDHCENLYNLNGLNGLVSIGKELNIDNCESLILLRGLTHLSSIGGNCTLYNNHLLFDLSSLEALDTIRGALVIAYNPALFALTGLESLQYAQSVTIESNYFLKNLNGLRQLTTTYFIILRDNRRLTDISGTKLFEDFRGDLILDDLSIENVDALAGISSLASLQLSDNESLTNISGLKNLIRIDSLIVISGNINLSDISGFDHVIDYQGETLVLRDNYSISNCAVEALCNWLSRPDEIDHLTIFTNGVHCAYQLELEKACFDSGISETNFLLWPNPCHERLYVFANVPYLELTVRVRDFSGRVLAEDTFERNWHFDSESLIAGIYFVEIEIHGNKRMAKMIKI